MVKTSAAKKPTVFSRTAFIALLLLTVMATTLMGAGAAEAASASLSWSAPADRTGITGYKMHIGSSSRSYQQHVDVGNNTTFSTSSLTDGSTYFFAVTSYNAAGLESVYSNEVTKNLTSVPATYVVSASAGSGGTITALNNTKVSTASNGTTTLTSVTVADGASQTFSIAAATGYRVSNVTVDGVSVGAVTSYTFSAVKANHSISATFAAIASYTISASAGTGGSITPSGTSTQAANTSRTYTITPATGYTIAGVTVDGAAVGAVASYTFSNITANHTISASFAANSITSYSISASAGTGGSISPAGSVSVSRGASRTFTITPSTGYRIAALRVDGVSVSAVTSYTFSNVTANHSIAASFVATTTTARVVFATNCGGSQLTDSTGTVYRADAYYSGGTAGYTATAIAGTTDDGLYTRRRIGSFSYNIPLANGNYSVTLGFAETYYSSVGARIFDVKMEGLEVISNLDVFARTGKNVAYNVTIPVTVSGGQLNIGIIGNKGSAMLQAIKVQTR